MNRIILAYAPQNELLAKELDQKLSPVGIPFDHINGTLQNLPETGVDPVMLLVTDQLLTNEAIMDGLLSAIQSLHQQKRLWIILADTTNAAGEATPIQLDRMSNVLHYMKYWQDAWISLSDRFQHAETDEKSALAASLDRIRNIANQTGDLIGLIREVGYTRWEQLLANDYEALFQRFGLMDWHNSFRKQSALIQAPDQQDKPAFLPEVHLSKGLLSPEPFETPIFPVAPPPEDESVMLAEDLVASSTESYDEPEVSDFLKQTVKDAWVWLEKGHLERGFDLFKLALQQDPEIDWLKQEYQKALSQYAKDEAQISTKEEQTVTTHGENTEVKSYDLMGDLAVERGDYLFAKYCWDRVVELDPEFPNIYRKLGLMTATHLKDYRETALIYLQKAFSANPEDREVKNMLQETTQEPVLVPPHSGQNQPEATPSFQTQMPKSAELVLITGATSGIGKATAEIFAKNGYRLILTGRRIDRLVALKNQFESSYNSEVLILPFDVRDHGAVEAALSNLPEGFNIVDILINNAGLAKGLAPIHEGQLDHWETMIDTNIKGLLYVTRLISPGMVQRRKGHIINICSSAGREAYPNGNVYCATKFAVDALTKSIRFDLHPYDIRVSQVSPGHVEETEFALNRFDGDTERAKIYQEFQPLKSSDVAEAIYFMATRPAYVNIVDIQMFATQQASSMVINKNGRRFE
jgi:NADP-dependent 3-hydroxy acid dehydrogenase YdfG